MLLDEIDELPEYIDKIIKIKNNKGNYIIYDATLNDLKILEEELGKIGTHFIQKQEVLVVNTDNVPNPFIDRSQVILDLYQHEFDFLYSKYEVISELMTIYDNNSEIVMQKSIMQKVIDLMASRPLFDLDFQYFTNNYLMEIELNRKKASFLHALIDYQVILFQINS